MHMALRLFLIFLLAFFAFTAGRRWESFSIKKGLEETGRSITRYGDHAWIEITGTVKEVDQWHK